MSKPIMNVLGLSNAITKKEWCTNPFVTNTVMMCEILKRAGYFVRFFGAEGSEVACDESHAVIKKIELQDAYGDQFFKQVKDWNVVDAEYAHEIYTANAKKKLKAVTKPGEYLLSLAGPPDQDLCNALSADPHNLIIVEPAVGYGVGFSQFKVYPSEAALNGAYGQFHENWAIRTAELPDEEKHKELFVTSCPYGVHRPHDVVIPHGLFPDFFEVSEKRDDYMLQISRIIPSKGIEMAIRVSQHLGRKLIIAGHGDFEQDMGFPCPKHVELVGPVLFEKRKKLIANAHCVICWTLYNEPFGYFPKEGNMSGVPAVTGKKGAFPETITPEVGFTTKTFKETIEAVEACADMNGEAIRQHTIDNFSVAAVTPQYDKYFTDLQSHIHADKTGQGFYHL